ncbi:hypothetical protein KCU95_g13446, partial [Aureobasidium melanogenum]
MYLSLPDKSDVNHPFFNYTSGRWLYNEQTRRDERHLVFDARALLQIIVESVNRQIDCVSTFSKIAEGGSYRIFEAVFDDKTAAIARLPYPCTLPPSFGIASEVATMQFLRLHGVPVPQLYAWAPSAENAVGSAYIIMAKVEGQELEHTWYDMSVSERMNMIEKVVQIERRLFQIQLPASGSIYHRTFLDSQQGVDQVPITTADTDENEFSIGPSNEYLWWYARRDEVAVNRGPWLQSEDVMKSVGERELAWLEKFANPRYPREPLYRAFYDNREVRPDIQIQVLRDYLNLVPLLVPEQAKLTKPTIRHPDLSPSNIFISDTGEITGLIDWQHTSVLPLFLQAKIPKHFQNWGDEDSENFRAPRLPESFDDLEESEQISALETYRKRQMHYFYVGYTERHNKPHFEAIGKPHLVMVNNLYDIAARPWEGDNTSLKAEIIKLSRRWFDTTPSRTREIFPVNYTEKEITQCLAIDEKQQEADAQMQTLRDCFTTNIDGWVSSELYEQAKARAEDVRQQMVDAADTDEERREIEENWPFHDHVEID